MIEEFTILKERVERLRKIHLKAIASFHAFEVLQEYRATNIHGAELAGLRAQAVASYKGFFNTAQDALNTELHIAVAKLFDSHKDALHIDKLVNFAEANQTKITASQGAALDEDSAVTTEITRVYPGLDKNDLMGIKNDLDNAREKIARLKNVRDQEVAHINLSQPKTLSYLTYEEFVELISLSEKIVNLISKRLYGDIALFGPYIKQVVGDTQSLLNLVGKAEGIIETRSPENS